MRKSLVVFSFCAAAMIAVLNHIAFAADSAKNPVPADDIRPTISQGDASAGKALSATCAACHGANGVSAIPINPSLAGQGAPYLFKQLSEFKSGARNNAIMAGMVANLSVDDMHNLAAFYSEMAAPQGISQPENLELGKQIYQGGITAIQVPACSSCHAPDGAGNSAAKFPRLAGQNSEYIAAALQNFRSGARANDSGSMMRMVAERLSDTEIAALANYIQGLY